MIDDRERPGRTRTRPGLLGHGHVIPRPDGSRARCGGPRLCRKCAAEQDALQAAVTAERERDGAALAAVYRERAQLLAFLAAAHPGRAWLSSSDPNAPEWPVLTVLGAAGQMTWHVSREDLDLLDHVPWARPGPTEDRPPAWDGHSTEEKYRRLRKLVRRMENSGA